MSSRLSRKRSTTGTNAPKSKRAKSNAPTSNKRLTSTQKSSFGNLEFDEDDKRNLKQPYVNQAILLKIYLNKDGKPVTGKTVPLDVMLLHDNGQQEVSEDHYKVEGNKINKDGVANLNVTITALSKDYEGNSFTLVAKPSSSKMCVEELSTEPFTVVSQRLKITNEAPNLWYKDEGGRDKSMEFHIELCNNLGIHKFRDVPLLVTLHYDTEGYPQALTHTKATATGENADLQLLQIARDTQPIVRHGEATVKLRINDVSKNHMTHAFIVKISPNTIKDPDLADIASAFSTPIVVKSKRNNNNKNKKKKKKAAKNVMNANKNSKFMKCIRSYPSNGRHPFHMNSPLDNEVLRSMKLPLITAEMMKNIHEGNMSVPQCGAILGHWGYAVNNFVKKTNDQLQNLLLFNAQVAQPLLHQVSFFFLFLIHYI
jgi:hypothetical protein